MAQSHFSVLADVWVAYEKFGEHAGRTSHKLWVSFEHVEYAGHTSLYVEVVEKFWACLKIFDELDVRPAYNSYVSHTLVISCR